MYESIYSLAALGLLTATFWGLFKEGDDLLKPEYKQKFVLEYKFFKSCSISSRKESTLQDFRKNLAFLDKLRNITKNK